MHEFIKKRRSIRAFSDKGISKDDMQEILEAATWAPSSLNEQPWRYIYAYRNTDGFKKIWDCLVPSNQTWTDKAAVLMISIAKKTLTRNGKPNRHYMHDTGLANENLIIQAISMDIYAHPMGGFDMEKTRETFALTDDDEAVCFIALGYKGDPQQLEEPNRTRETEERSRKSITEISKDIS
jgi:nitroreductase